MLKRRSLTTRFGAATLLASGGAAHAASPSFEDFLAGVAAEAQQGGVSPATLRRALDPVRPNDKVLQLDRRQPEFTLTWDQYRDGRLSQQRVDRGRQAFAEHRALLDSIAARYRVDPRVIVAIWGLETNYGGFTGNFNVIEALATLAWEGRRAAFFRKELLAALRILEQGDVAPERMRGSHAGAMGHPQFMPTSFERLAVDFDGDGRRDIWDTRADALASIANYLAANGWQDDASWGREVVLPAGFDPAMAGRDNRRPLRDWAGMGVMAADGAALPLLDMDTAILLPGGAGGQAFAVYGNFNVIRRYNPSDYYALLIGLLSDRVA
ncbi:lytic murein transglycosylase [Pseudoroseomonas wenyumeiae]|uniref:Lytic murein transglycosylase n=1 Tax=Teichococcus wenyumeiae TaxID=2478470 RepID=A0A3A9J7E0_9PROT|nr:lytic murein transglycosylase [Pseudoroseomonas wenyumeiae]RKK03147.1 lytic murein transglycosylase [Pseudoroseomonas wenyumeiae]RMI19201.1 lytic murein transglycosylase [Pseudoroseomonas wenyumeiae]